MLHLESPFHCGCQKPDNTSGIKMLHQMCVRVAVVALGLVLMVCYDEKMRETGLIMQG